MLGPSPGSTRLLFPSFPLCLVVSQSGAIEQRSAPHQHDSASLLLTAHTGIILSQPATAQPPHHSLQSPYKPLQPNVNITYLRRTVAVSILDDFFFFLFSKIPFELRALSLIQLNWKVNGRYLDVSRVLPSVVHVSTPLALVDR